MLLKLSLVLPCQVLMLLLKLCDQKLLLDLLLLLRGRYAQEVLGQLPDVYLQDRSVSAGTPAPGRPPACTTRVWGSSLQGLCSRGQGAQHKGLRGDPSTSLPKAGLAPLPGLQATQASDALVHMLAVPAADQDHGKHGLSTTSCSLCEA